MKYLLIFALFNTIGWILEVIYRSIAAKKFINPGLMLGASLPIYGVGGIILNLIGRLSLVDNYYLNIIFLSIISALILTILELIGGLILLKLFNIKLWDYSKSKFNYKGLICLRMTLIWGILALSYFLLINSLMLKLFQYLNYKIIIFILGIYLGVFLLDLFFSCKLLFSIKKYSLREKTIINLELLKLQARGEKMSIAALKKIFYLLYPYKNIHEFILLENKTI